MLEAALAAQRQRSLLRRRRLTCRLDAVRIEIDGHPYVSFASNDYLGLSRHPRLVAAGARAIELAGAGSGASALISGHSPLHAEAEAAIARWKKKPAAVLLPSGYQANHAAVQAIAGAARAAGRSVRFLLDKLAHASLIDAARGSGEPYRLFAHNDLAKLERLLDAAPPDELQVVLTESIFSMDGDAADLRGLVELKRRRPFILLLDEAHASGVYGDAGSGYASELGLSDDIDVFVVTLSKALGGIGGAVCGSATLIDGVVNFGRAYIYSTAVPPSVAATAIAAIQLMHDEPERQERLRRRSRDLRAALHAAEGDSPIIPVILGSEERAIAASERLAEAGLLVPAVRPPTVPRGSSRLRITISSEHTDVQCNLLIRSVRQAQAGR